MKKIDIICEYNRLSDEMKRLFAEYRRVTGYGWAEETRITADRMEFAYMSVPKDILEKKLEIRNRHIRIVRDIIDTEKRAAGLEESKKE